MIPFHETKKIRNSLIIMVITFIVGIYVMTSYFQRLEEKYPFIIKADHIDNKLIDIRPYQSIAYVEFDNNRKMTLDFARNINYQPANLNEFLKLNDHILKKKNSDTLFVIRTDSVFTFVLGEIIK